LSGDEGGEWRGDYAKKTARGQLIKGDDAHHKVMGKRSGITVYWNKERGKRGEVD